MKSWKEVRAEKVKAALSERASLAFSALNEFHLAGEHDQKSHGSWAAEGDDADADVPHGERGVLRNASAAIKAHIRGMLVSRRKVEPEVTDTLESVASEHGGKMLGLRNRFKDAAGVIEKVGRKAREKGISEEQAAKGITDALRYTMEVPPGKYVEGVSSAVKALESAGYEFLEVENNWLKGDSYNGVNSVFVHKETGLKIELQFHTEESFKVKGTEPGVSTHKDYEYVRTRQGTSADRLLAHERMRQLADGITFPPGVEGLCAEVGPKCKDVRKSHRETLFASAEKEVQGWRARKSQ